MFTLLCCLSGLATLFGSTAANHFSPAIGDVYFTGSLWLTSQAFVNFAARSVYQFISAAATRAINFELPLASVVPNMLLPCAYVSAMLIAVACIVVFGSALLLYGDLKSDLINPNAFARQVNPMLKLEAWLQLPLLCCWLASLDWIGCVLASASLYTRIDLHRHGRLLLDVTAVFQEHAQRMYTRRWKSMAIGHTAMFFVAVGRLIYLVDMSRLAAIQDRRAAHQAELIASLTDENASFGESLVILIILRIFPDPALPNVDWADAARSRTRSKNLRSGSGYASFQDFCSDF